MIMYTHQLERWASNDTDVTLTWLLAVQELKRHAENVTKASELLLRLLMEIIPLAAQLMPGRYKKAHPSLCRYTHRRRDV